MSRYPDDEHYGHPLSPPLPSDLYHYSTFNNPGPSPSGTPNLNAQTPTPNPYPPSQTPNPYPPTTTPGPYQQAPQSSSPYQATSQSYSTPNPFERPPSAAYSGQAYSDPYSSNAASSTSVASSTYPIQEDYTGYPDSYATPLNRYENNQTPGPSVSSTHLQDDGYVDVGREMGDHDGGDTPLLRPQVVNIEEEEPREEENNIHYGAIPQRQPRRHKTIKKVPLDKVNFVVDMAVPSKLLDMCALKKDREFTHMRYTAATCDPDHFLEERYTLRQCLYSPQRGTELFIVMTMYNEDEQLFTRTMHGVMQNIKHLCERRRSRMWGDGGWKKVVVCIVSDGRMKINSRTLSAIAAMGVYQDGIAKNMVDSKPVTAHIYEYTTQISVSPSMRIEGTERGTVPCQIIFCLKEKIQKKINSHRWFFNAFCRVLEPNVCVLLDVGTRPGPTSIYHLWKAFDLNYSVGGACGKIIADKHKFGKNLLNPLVAAQNFEYKMSNILDKPLERVFGYITVLPGAFSAYRYIALQNDSTGDGPLQKYFLGEKMHGADADIFTANMYLAEDRILCWELVSKLGGSWTLHYVKSAYAVTDQVPELVFQRRRWLNGSCLAAILPSAQAVKHFRSRHPSLILNEDMTKLIPRLQPRTISEIMGSLRKHDCKEATSQLNISTFGESPALSNLSRHLYTGELHQGVKVALKCVRLDLSTQDIIQRELQRAARELFIWSRCHHPNILPLVGMALFRNQLTMVSPWMKHSNTRLLVAGQPREKRYSLCAQVVEGVEYLHTIGIAHGDLKADHVLLSGELNAQICGFGNASLIRAPQEFQNGHYNVSLNWAPPEMLQRTPQPSFSSDMYSLGMTIYELVSGSIPYAGSPESTVHQNILDSLFPERAQETLPAGEESSDMVWSLLRSCWAKDPTTRPKSGGVKEKLAEILWETEDIVITRETPVADMIAHLGRRGCKNIGDDIDTERCSSYAVSQGGLGDVYSGTLRDSTPVALKCLRPYCEQPDVAKKQFKRAARELYVWSKCNHPNVLGLIGLAEFRGQLAMVSPWMEHGSVRRFLESRLDFDRYLLCLQISDGVAYLHEVGVVHGDLKGDNVLVSNDLVPKLTDFGCAELREYTLKFSKTKTNASLSVPWAPPELFEDSPKKSPETDAYSLGMTILEVLKGSIPYEGMAEFRILRLVMGGVHPGRPSILTAGTKHNDKMWDLLKSCWAMDPASRPSAVGVRDKIKEIIKERDAGN